MRARGGAEAKGLELSCWYQFVFQEWENSMRFQGQFAWFLAETGNCLLCFCFSVHV